MNIDRILMKFCLALAAGINLGYLTFKKESIFLAAVCIAIVELDGRGKRYIYIMGMISGCIYANFLFGQVDFPGKEAKEYLVRVDEIRGERIIAEELGKDFLESVFSRKLVFYSDEDLKNGDVAVIRGRASSFEEKRNPGGFSEKNYYLGNNIYKRINLEKIEVTGRKQGFLDGYRERKFEFIDENFDEESAAFLKGIIFGDSAGISQDTRKAFQTLGISHLLAVSGLHVGIISGIVYFLIRRFSFKQKVMISGLVFFAYMIIAGGSPSITRAVVMIILVGIGKVKGRYIDMLTILAASALVEMVYNPFVIYSISFQLSYAVVLGIILLKDRVNYKWHLPWKKSDDIINISLISLIASFPIVGYYFHKPSVLGVLGNLLFVPAFTLILGTSIIIILIARILILKYIFVGFLNSSIKSFLNLVELVSEKMSFININVSAPNLAEIFIYYCIVYFVFYDIKINRKIIIFFIAAFLSLPNHWAIFFVDVGEGDGIFLKTEENRTLVVDGGSYGKDMEDFLGALGVNRPDLMIVTHPDSDHVNGLIWLEKCNPAKILLIPPNAECEKMDDLLRCAKESGTEVYYAYKGKRTSLGETLIEIISPDKNRKSEKINNQSVVCKMKYKGNTLLLTGDIEKEVMDSLRIDEKIDLLKVPHHGSKTGLSDKFFKNNDFQVGIISVGKNRYGHPNPELLHMLAKSGIKIYRTDQGGCIRVRIDEAGKSKIRTFLR